MAFTARDVIVYLTDFPWKFLVKNHDSNVTRTAVTTYSKATNRRNQFAGDQVLIPPGSTTADTVAVSPITTPLVSPVVVATAAASILSDAAAENAGATGFAPRPEVFTRYKLIFGVTDVAVPANSPYFCWEDQFMGLGDVDPNNELDE